MMNSRLFGSFASLALACWLPATGRAAEARFMSQSQEVVLSQKAPGLERFDIDGLGLGKRGANVVLGAARAAGEDFTADFFRPDGGLRGEYRMAGQRAGSPAVWSIEIRDRELRFTSQWSPGCAPGQLVLAFDPGRCAATLLGLLNPDGSIRLPALLNLPNQGSIRIAAPNGAAEAIGYATPARGAKITGRAGVNVSFPPATAAHPRVEYLLTICAIFPKVAGISDDARFDSFRRNWLDALQFNPNNRMLANNTRSSTCAFCFYEYADIAAKTPPLADGLTALDVVRETLDAIFAGKQAYGMAGGSHPVDTSDTAPSILIAAAQCVEAGENDEWLAANYGHLRDWADKMLATDTSGDGLVKYRVSGNSGTWPEGVPKVRPSNWWDTIGFGYEDAYANALAYRSLGCMARMAARLGKDVDAKRYLTAARKLKASYFRTFYDPGTGVLGGWRSADGQLHDYYFLWVNGIAIDYGLVPKDRANAILDKLMAKMKQVGYAQFHLGLPGNLVTVALKDYAHRTPDGHLGGGVREDNADGFQKYENGGATGCFAYFTLAALDDLGRTAEAEQILFPMLEEYGREGFQGRGRNGRSNDWRKWDGTPMGYEGYLTDNYYALLAVLPREDRNH